uniref:Uncharacterized protein n=1 Tax=Florenciella parvula TaxID=236787 RepID=A0A6T7GCZ0_9STRA|mmetsp:Transcript_8258/g.17495  ORF Transcript_8258/g.17495 Transcript_8258/m.17495 type:complete len:112 (+) Transcript_8258:1275-1610(+)
MESKSGTDDEVGSAANESSHDGAPSSLMITFLKAVSDQNLVRAQGLAEDILMLEPENKLVRAAGLTATATATATATSPQNTSAAAIAIESGTARLLPPPIPSNHHRRRRRL